MKFLLAAVNAKYIHSNPAVYSLKVHDQQQTVLYIIRSIQTEAGCSGIFLLYMELEDHM